MWIRSPIIRGSISRTRLDVREHLQINPGSCVYGGTWVFPRIP
jgi:hypothetical protein